MLQEGRPLNRFVLGQSNIHDLQVIYLQPVSSVFETSPMTLTIQVSELWWRYHESGGLVGFELGFGSFLLVWGLFAGLRVFSFI